MSQENTLVNKSWFARYKIFDREHLLVIIGALFISLHMVDELVRQEGLAPPFIPLLIIVAVYSFLPIMLRALAIFAIGAIFFVFQLPGHVMPFLERGPVGSDYTGLFPMIGGAILMCIAVRLFKNR